MARLNQTRHGNSTLVSAKSLSAKKSTLNTKFNCSPELKIKHDKLKNLHGSPCEFDPDFEQINSGKTLLKNGKTNKVHSLS